MKYALQSSSEELPNVLCTADAQRVPILTLNQPDSQYYIIHFNTNVHDARRGTPHIYIMDTQHPAVGIVSELVMSERPCFDTSMIQKNRLLQMSSMFCEHVVMYRPILIAITIA